MEMTHSAIIIILNIQFEILQLELHSWRGRPYKNEYSEEAMLEKFKTELKKETWRRKLTSLLR